MFFKASERSINAYVSQLLLTVRVLIQQSDWFISIDKKNNTDPDITLLEHLDDTIGLLIYSLFTDSYVDEESERIKLGDGFVSGNLDLKVSRERQDMLMHLNAHDVVLLFIQKKLWCLEKILGQEFGRKYKLKLINLFRNCYTFLILFCKENKVIQ